MSQPLKRTFFQTAETRWMLLITTGLGMLIWSWLAPQTIPGPYGLYLGPIGMLGKYLGENFPVAVSALVYIAAILHVGEALYAVKLCKDLNLTRITALKWFGQTLLFGVASLHILRKRIGDRI